MSRLLEETDITQLIKDLEKSGYVLQFSEAGYPYINSAFKKIGQIAGEQIEIGFAFDVTRKEALDEVAKIITGFSKTAPATAIDDIKSSLKKALEEGKSIQEAQKIVKDLPTTTWKTRSDLIARTEIMRASNYGMIEAYKQTGIVTKKIWVAAGDACPICAPLHNMTVEIEETFFDMGDEIEYATKDKDGNQISKTYKCEYSTIDAPPLHVNCRCCTAAETL